MICSFTLNLKPLNFGERIKKYDNYNSIKKILSAYDISREELKYITVSNFITQDRVYEGKNYSLKISCLDSEVTFKILRIFFLLKLENVILNVSNNSFILLNIHHNTKSAGQLQKIEINPVKEIKLRYITPVFFKIGSVFTASFEPRYVIKNLTTKLKKSSLKDDRDFLLTGEEVEKIKYKIVWTKEMEIKKYMTKGLIGEVIYYLDEKNEKLLKKINNIFNFGTFSGVGYLTEQGYGQNMIEAGEEKDEICNS